MDVKMDTNGGVETGAIGLLCEWGGDDADSLPRQFYVAPRMLVACKPTNSAALRITRQLLRKKLGYYQA